jgi:hypothetical protein
MTHSRDPLPLRRGCAYAVDVVDTAMAPGSGRQTLLDECRTIEENSAYTAQAHFEVCDDAGRMAKLLTIGPSIIGGLAAAFVGVGVPKSLGEANWLGLVAAVAAVMTGLASGLGVDKKATAHQSAGNVLTQLRHDARALRESFAHMMSDELLYADVRRLHDRYGMLIQVLEITDNKYFERSRRKIQAGWLEPDFRQKSPPGLLGTADTAGGAPVLPSGPPRGPGGFSGST